MKTRLSFLLALLCVSFVHAEYATKISEDMQLRLGGDIRARYEGYTSGVVAPNAPKNKNHSTEYFRFRTRAYGALDIGQDITINLRFANRVHYVTTSPAKPNNNDRATWEFPDEVYVDAANVVFRNLLDGHLTLTLGRQDLFLGNGMLFCEGTPMDQGRSVYSDGVTAVYEQDSHKLTAFIFYDRYKDHFVFINDQNRDLRAGDIFTSGLYYTYSLNDAANFDVYYMFNDLDDQHATQNADGSLSLHTVGARFFGKYPIMEHSLEMARQFGRDAYGNHLSGTMIDARLKFHLCDDSRFKPVLGLEFTHFGGDDEGTDHFEGWVPLMTECPLWGEELIPTMTRGLWTNLNMGSLTMSVDITEKCNLLLYATDFYADEKDGSFAGNACPGGGRHIGLLIGAKASYKFNEYLSSEAYISHFMPGDFYDQGEDSNWFRLEITARF